MQGFDLSYLYIPATDVAYNIDISDNYNEQKKTKKRLKKLNEHYSTCVQQ